MRKMTHQPYIRVHNFAGDEVYLHDLNTNVAISAGDFVDLKMTSDVQASYKSGELDERQDDGAVFITSTAGAREPLASSVAKNGGGGDYASLSPGRVIAQDPEDSQYHPLINDEVGAGGVSNANDIPVTKVDQYATGMWIRIPAYSYGAGGFRKITNVDSGNDEITVNGPALTLASGDSLYVDPSRSHDTVQSASGSGTQIDVNDASKFEAGQVVHVGQPKYKVAFDVTSYQDGLYQVTYSVFYAVRGTARSRDITAEYDAAGDSAGVVATELKNDIDRYDAISASVQNTSEVVIDLGAFAQSHEPSVRDFHVQYSHRDPGGEVGKLGSAYDVSQWAEIQSVDTGADTITLARTLTWTNGAPIVTETGKHDVLQADLGGDALIERCTQVDESKLEGLTPQARHTLTDDRQMVLV